MLPGFWTVINGKVETASIINVYDCKLYKLVEASSIALLPSSSNKQRQWTERELQQHKEIKDLKRLVKIYKKTIDIQVKEYQDLTEKLEKCRNKQK